MTDPTEIAAKLTPAQVRALRDLQRFHGQNYSECSNSDWEALVAAEVKPEIVGWNDTAHRTEITPLGRAVLAALDAKEAGK